MLNNREVAALVWLSIIAIGLTAMVMRTPKLRRQVKSIAVQLLTPTFIVPFALLVGWVVLLAVIGSRVGIWDGDFIPETVVWFCGPAIALLFSLNRTMRERHFFRTAARSTIAPTIFVEFFLNVWVFGLVVELLIQPILGFFGIMSVVASTKPEYKPAKQISGCVLGAIGSGFIAFAAYSLFRDWPDVDLSNTSKELVLPIWLTLGVLPYIYLFGLYGA